MRKSKYEVFCYHLIQIQLGHYSILPLEDDPAWLAMPVELVGLVLFKVTWGQKFVRIFMDPIGAVSNSRSTHAVQTEYDAAYRVVYKKARHWFPGYTIKPLPRKG